MAQMIKNLPTKQETQVPPLGQEDSPGEGKGNPLQYSCLGNPKYRGTWQATVYGVAKELNTTERLTLTHLLNSLAISFLGVYLKEMNHMSIQRYV